MSTLPILVVEHEAGCPPAWFGEWLLAEGAVLDVLRPYAGDRLPGDLSGHGGLLVLGGSMGADDDADHPWLTDVKGLIREAAATGVPTLGICLGHQLAAVALGGTVHVNPRGQQIGVLDIGWTDVAADDPLTGRLPRPSGGVQWNNDVVAEPPPGTVVLAATATGELQAARFAPTVWGVQWHPEAGEEIVTAWTEDERDDAAARGVDLDAYVRDVARATDRLRETWAQLAAGFVDLLDADARAVS
ncbi:type 1 glutamine amidotransferase [Nocardioides mesophilus]|uniref:Type 1 glutamine amidotransferase n=1 Tax=Nocardioides mesophilus TaxID=433659 RepID=A0A7G9RCD2_9ACTN|nr:type 1 glutamine amidotransferase [Nocardioides mesophilus]QNN53257.1 type 1 glutamine amidotransferase [Nocardioides mesophilus]